MIFYPIESKVNSRSLYIGAIGIVIATIASIILIISTIINIKELEDLYSSIGKQYSSYDLWMITFSTLIMIFLVILFYFLIYVNRVYKMKYVLKETLIKDLGLIKKKIPYEWILKVFNSPKFYFDPRPTWRRYRYIDLHFYLHNYICDVDGAIHKVFFLVPVWRI